MVAQALIMGIREAEGISLQVPTGPATRCCARSSAGTADAIACMSRSFSSALRPWKRRRPGALLEKEVLESPEKAYQESKLEILDLLLFLVIDKTLERLAKLFLSIFEVL